MLPAYFKCIVAGALLMLLASCQPTYTTLTHNTPHFTKGNQLEASLSFGMLKGNANLAYSPVKYLALQANGFAYERNGYYTRYAEAAAGFYLPFKELVIGLNGGYGMGMADWQLRSIYGYSGYTVNHAVYDIQNAFAHVYLSFTGDDGDFYCGPSLKINRFTHAFSLAEADAGYIRPETQNKQQTNIELTAFLKQRLAKRLYFNFNGGISMPNNPNVFILRLGLTVKL